MKNLLVLIVILCLFSCKHGEKEKLNHLVTEWSGKEVRFPNTVKFTLLGTDINYLPQSKYKIISYIDSIGCTSCKLRLPQWKNLISQLDSIGNSSVSFFFHPKDEDELTHILKQENFAYPVCIDRDDSLNKLNHFPSDIAFQTFLLDKNNKVLAIGNPVHNPKVKELYLKIIQGKGGEKEDAVIKTEIQVKEQIVSFGRFDWRQAQKVNFTIRNVGKHPLVINDVTTSCGCTSVEYSHEPVRPGDSISLQVAYKADNPEHFNKTITVFCNAEPALLKLRIMGDAE